MPPKRRQRDSDHDDQPDQQQQQQPQQQAGDAQVRRPGGRYVRARNWVFTLWELEAPATDPPRDGVSYIRYQQERAPESAPDNTTGGLHYQGYLELDGRFSAPEVRRIMGWEESNVYLAPRQGTQKQALDYCWKVDTAVPGTQREGGTRAPPDAAGCWADATEAIKAGATFEQICHSHLRLAVQNASGIQKVIAAINPSPEWRDVSVHYLWGPPGTGKTRRVFREHGTSAVYKKLDGQWWDGYEGQDVVLFDDFYGTIPLSYLLQLLDGHPLSVNVRGSTRVAKWTKVYITSNRPFETMYPGEPAEKIAALRRRIPSANIERIEFPRPAPAVIEEEVRETQVKVPEAPTGIVAPDGPLFTAQDVENILRNLLANKK